ncbi:hypothetical protein [Nocardioides sp.]|uniref:hypothetical protein n=1 Tax=Nocardioides sp. TaxID=35761 RepID=UPI0027274EFC|nr:hypothetical protein [Nocardioides sp.]MDO9457742.1 hypothetical protein [Nocardioides sp.]
MRIAHLLRLEGELDGDAGRRAVAAIRDLVHQEHQPWCAAVQIDLGEVEHLPATLVHHLRDLRRVAHARRVTLTLQAPRSSPAFRVLAFHQGMGLALPPVDTTGPLPD